MFHYSLPARNKAVLAENIRRHKKLRFPGPGSGQRLAAAVGTAPQIVSKWLNGSRMPTFEQLYRLAKVFGVSPLELCGIKDDREQPRSPAIVEVLREMSNLLERDVKPHVTAKSLQRMEAMIRNAIKEMKEENERLQA